jgi:hypothetical protein
MTQPEHAHAHARSRLSARHRGWLYCLGLLLWLSGVGWLIVHYGPVDTIAGAHPAEPGWLRLHGAAVIGFLVVFGALLPGHVRRGWRQGQNRGSGLAVISVTAVLTVSGYGLYYLVNDTWRAWTSVIHWAVGVPGGILLAVHVWLGRRLVARARLTRAARALHHRPQARGPGPHTS